MAHYIRRATARELRNPKPGGRIGSAYLTHAKLRELFGEPHQHGSPDDKISALWYVATPRGVCTLYDYWWNQANEWSIGAHGDARAGLWLARYLREHGIPARVSIKSVLSTNALYRKWEANP